MRRDLLIGGVLAVALHALLLFGIRIGSDAVALPMGDKNDAVEVNLVAAPPAAAEESPPPPDPTPPDPDPTPPPPDPDPNPPPPDPAPMPDPAPAEHPPEVKPAPHSMPHPMPARPHGPPASASLAVSSGSPGPAAPHGPVTSARYRSNPQPEYPAEARRLKQQGVAYLHVQVSAEGRPSSVTLSRSSGFPLLDSAAIGAVRHWTFEPGRAGGLPISSSVEVPVRFRLN